MRRGLWSINPRKDVAALLSCSTRQELCDDMLAVLVLLDSHAHAHCERNNGPGQATQQSMHVLGWHNEQLLAHLCLSSRRPIPPLERGWGARRGNMQRRDGKKGIRHLVLIDQPVGFPRPVGQPRPSVADCAAACAASRASGRLPLPFAAMFSPSPTTLAHKLGRAQWHQSRQNIGQVSPSLSPQRADCCCVPSRRRILRSGFPPLVTVENLGGKHFGPAQRLEAISCTRR